MTLDPDRFLKLHQDSGDFVDEPEPPERENYIRAPFGWPGGKWRCLQYILPKLPVRKIWVEPCGGSGIITINRRPSELEIFNDRHAGVVTFYRCIRDKVKCDALVERLKLVVHSREEFVWCRETWQSCTDDVERAARWYYMLRTSFSQLGRNFARATRSRDQIGIKLQRGLNLFPTIHRRFVRIQVENLDAIQCIRDFDSRETVFYVDPDYMGADPGIYEHRVKQQLLLNTIKDCKGFFAVSNYANQLYDSYQWDERLTWSVFVSMTAQSFDTDENHLRTRRNVMDRQQRAEEVLWIRESK